MENVCIESGCANRALRNSNKCLKCIKSKPANVTFSEASCGDLINFGRPADLRLKAGAGGGSIYLDGAVTGGGDVFIDEISWKETLERLEASELRASELREEVNNLRQQVVALHETVRLMNRHDAQVLNPEHITEALDQREKSRSMRRTAWRLKSMWK